MSFDCTTFGKQFEIRLTNNATDVGSEGKLLGILKEFGSQLWQAEGDKELTL